MNCLHARQIAFIISARLTQQLQQQAMMSQCQFWAIEATLAYNLMSLFRQAVVRSEVHHTLATLHHKVFSIGAF